MRAEGKTTTSRRLHLLDGLRGIAAIGVMLYHAELQVGISGWFGRAYLFVDFFFLLSGFVLTLAAEERMKQACGAVRFLRARIVRLWPITALGVVAGTLAALTVHGPEGLIGFTVLGLMMVPALFHEGELFPLNAPQWSLFFELIANLVHALLLRHLTDRALLCVAAIWGVALTATTVHFGANDLGPFSFNWWWGLPRVFFSYCLGVWFGRKWIAGWIRPIVSWEVALVLPAVCVVALTGLPMARAAGDLVIVVLVFPTCFWLAAGAAVPENAKPWLGGLGDISFPLYALHLPILTLCMQLDGAMAGLAAAIVVLYATLRVASKRRQARSPAVSHSA